MAKSAVNGHASAAPTRKVLAATFGSVLGVVVTKLLFRYVLKDWADDPDMEKLITMTVTMIVTGISTLAAGYYTPPHPEEGVKLSAKDLRHVRHHPSTTGVLDDLPASERADPASRS